MEDQASGRTPHKEWRFWTGWLAFCQFIAVCVAVVNAFHAVNLNRAVVGYLISWPVVIEPAWLGVVAAVAALIVIARIWSRLGRGSGTSGQSTPRS